MEKTEQVAQVKRCRVGIKTDTPCPFVATEPAPHQGSDEPRMCAYHAADQLLHDEIDEYGIALDRVVGFLRETRDNMQLTGDLERLEKDYRERLDFLKSTAEAFRVANEKVTIYMGR